MPTNRLLFIARILAPLAVLRTRSGAPNRALFNKGLVRLHGRQPAPSHLQTLGGLRVGIGSWHRGQFAR
jgi:hypothetical protein